LEEAVKPFTYKPGGLMRGVINWRDGAVGLVFIMILFALLLICVPAVVSADDGIGQPGDGLNSPPSDNGETTSSGESLLLLVSLNLIV
jgi:hypothetical protein